MVATKRQHVDVAALKPRGLTTKRKILIGGLGALTPIVMNLLVVQLDILLLNLTVLAIAGYLLRVLILFYLGGLVAYLHKDESCPIKLFELGIIAPALITGVLTAKNVEVPKAPPQASAIFSLIPSVLAQSKGPDNLKKFSLPKESWTQQISRGIYGTTPKEVWFVIASSHEKEEEAMNWIRQFGQREGFKAEVYAPYGEELPGYSVVIGANLTFEAAQHARQKAIEAGYPQDTRLWTFPGKR